MNWNSRLSIWIDIVLGVLPAILFGCLSIVGLVATVSDIRHWFAAEKPRHALGPDAFFISIIGLLACVSMLIVTSIREQAKPKWLHMLFLAGGVVLAVWMYGSALGTIFQNASMNNWLSMMPYLAIVLVALKHIVMLARSGVA